MPEWTTIKFRVSAGLASSALPITVDIPQNGKDIVKVEIYVGDEPNPQYSETVYERGRSREHHPLRHGPENGEGLL